MFESFSFSFTFFDPNNFLELIFFALKLFYPVFCDKFCLCPNLNITIKTMQYSGVLTQLKGGNISVNDFL